MRKASSQSTIQVVLTGSIGMGKSTISNQLQFLGFSIFDADKEVHKMYCQDGLAIEPIRKILPDVIVNGMVDRKLLSSKILANQTILKDIEQIVHPLVRIERQKFYQNCVENGELVVFYDIPLYFENQVNYEVDYSIVVTAKPEIQRQRVLNRPGMTIEKFETILSKQVPDDVKRKLADFIISTDYSGFAEGKSQLATTIQHIIENNPNQWMRWKSRKSSKQTNKVNQSEKEEMELTDYFDAIIFDLDDTLAPVTNQILPAQNEMIRFIESSMPKTFIDLQQNPNKLRQIMSRLSGEQPLIAHDYTILRYNALREIASQYGEEALAMDAVQIFIKIRSDVGGHLYSDVIPCLHWLTIEQGVKVAVFSNGNADLTNCSVLKPYLSLTLGASDVGAAKPSPIPFLACLNRLQVLPSRTLYVGDNYAHDVIGAKNAGLHTALIIRSEGMSIPQVASQDNSKLLSETTASDEIDQKSNEEKFLAYLEADMHLNSLEPTELWKGFLRFISNKKNSS